MDSVFSAKYSKILMLWPNKEYMTKPSIRNASKILFCIIIVVIMFFSTLLSNADAWWTRPKEEDWYRLSTHYQVAEQAIWLTANKVKNENYRAFLVKEMQNIVEYASTLQNDSPAHEDSKRNGGNIGKWFDLFLENFPDHPDNAFKYLGYCIHLIADMNVPAHALNIPHLFPVDIGTDIIFDHFEEAAYYANVHGELSSSITDIYEESKPYPTDYYTQARNNTLITISDSYFSQYWKGECEPKENYFNDGLKGCYSVKSFPLYGELFGDIKKYSKEYALLNQQINNAVKYAGMFLLAIDRYLSQPKSTSVDNWQLRNPMSQSITFYGVAYGNGIYVAVASNGTIVTSPDKIAWISGKSGVSSSLYGVTYGNGVFVGVGRNGTVLKSSDGVNWVKSATVTSNLLWGVTYSGGIYIAVGNNGTILTSSNGVAWTKRISGTTKHLWEVSYGNNTFVVVGNDGIILTSSNGINWTNRQSGTAQHLYGVAFGNNTFVAVGSGQYQGTILTSRDTVTWEYAPSGSGSSLYRVTHSNNKFVAVGDGGNIMESTNGFTWTVVQSYFESYNLYGVGCGNEKCVVGGSAASLFVANYWTNWTNLRMYSLGTSEDLKSITYGNGTFVAVGSGSLGGRVVLTSQDGVAWTERKENYLGSWLDGVTYGRGIFVAAGGWNFIQTSYDGIIWEDQSITQLLPLLWSFNNASFYNNKYFAVEQTIFSSSDGKEWNEFAKSNSGQLRGLAWGNGTYVVVGDNGIIGTSQNEIYWTRVISGVSDNLNGVVYGRNVFVAVGDHGTITTSSDGTNWTFRMSGTINNLYGIDFGSGVFVAVGDNGTILTSSDGVAWTKKNSGTAKRLYGVTHGNNTFIIAGSSGTILQSQFESGDINGNGRVNMEDAILILQLLIGKNSLGTGSIYSNPYADINDDRKLGMEEVIFILQTIAGMRP